MSGVHLRKRPVTITGERYGDRDTGEWYPDCIGVLVAFILDKPRGQVSDDEIIDNIRKSPEFDPLDGKFTIYVYDDVVHHEWLPVRLGQWVLRGVQGEIYPCDHDVLRSTYDFIHDGGTVAEPEVDVP